MLGDPLGGRVRLLDGDGVAGLGRGRVADEDDRGLGLVGDLPHQPVVGVLVAQDPAAAVEVHDGGELVAHAGRADDPDLHLAGGAGLEGAVADVGGQFVDRPGLGVVERLAVTW